MKQILNLNGLWKFAPTYDQKPTNNHNVLSSNVPLYSHKDLNRSGWETVIVPGVWQRYAEKYSVFEGVCWFYREFQLDEPLDNAKIQLVCQGINYKADVYINSHLVGVHESAYTGFILDVSPYVQAGINAIAIQVDNRPTVVKWPNDWGYGVYGGIHRDIFLEIYQDSYLYDISLTPDYDVSSRQGLLKITAKGSAKSFTLELNHRVTEICRNANGEFHAELSYDDITPWSPEHPVLYRATVTVDENCHGDYRVGFRNVACQNRQFLLNGAPFELKGACYLCDSPKSGLAMGREELRNDLLRMKTANVNAIRTHYPMSQEFYELCDELGFAVWIEPNIYCSKPAVTETGTVFAQPEFINVAISMTQEMIADARRFASVVIYGIGNECNTLHPEAVPFFEILSSTVRDTDPTRPVGYAALYGQIGHIAHTIDVMGINSYYSWYGVIDTFRTEDPRNGVKRIADVSKVQDLIQKAVAETQENTVILLTEFGADSVPGNFSDDHALWSENYHAQVVEAYIAAARSSGIVKGYFVFAFTDYQDPSKPLNGMWNGLNLKGMLSYDRSVKLPYYALQKAYSKEP